MEPSFTTDKLEQELKQAQQFGRWLSDEERLALEEEETKALRVIEQQRHRRVRLIVLTGVCVLIPPLWGIAAGLSFYLLFPETAKRLALIASGGLIVLAVLSALVFGFLLITIASLLL
ncbi:hypothetical protein [Synechococcus sp. ROS8604]|uniref:hypothetical protein n=1 Tax=Synechococcus sp. ROS8604 TaxID=1442557 RepID=UPI00164618C4|nr:hypothetical protein [Synechococcus sp. ROS8604]QNI89020.1 putative conserved membrane protein [Synechococcus sp. ROS8604]